MRWRCLLAILLSLLYLFWCGHDLFSWNSIFFPLILAIIWHFGDFQEKCAPVIMRKIFYLDHVKKNESRQYPVPIYVFRSYNSKEELITAKGNERKLGFSDNFCLCCAQDIKYDTRFVLAERGSECFKCFMTRLHQEEIELFLLIQELPWPVQQKEFSENVFRLRIQFHPLQLKSCRGIYPTIRNYTMFLLLVPEFPFPYLYRGRLCVYSEEDKDWVCLLKVLDKRPIKDKKEQLFQKGTRELYSECLPHDE